MRVVCIMVLVIGVACSDEIIAPDRVALNDDSEAVKAVEVVEASSVANVTIVVDDARSGAIKQQAQSSLPAEHEKITFSTYAEVTAADIVEIVLLLDSELADEQKNQLAGGSAALLQHIINSHWKIAVVDLNTTTYPTSFITKYANYTDYNKQFAAAITSVAMPKEEQQSGAKQQGVKGGQQRGKLRVFILVTPQSFADTKLGENEMIIAEEHAHRTKVYALVNTDGNSEGFINWKNDSGRHVLSRYASLASDNSKALAEFSADIAQALRGMFAIPSPPKAILSSDTYTIAQMKIFNAPEGEKEQEGFIHDSHYQVKQNIVFTRAQFSEGVCVDVTLQP